MTRKKDYSVYFGGALAAGLLLWLLSLAESRLSLVGEWGLFTLAFKLAFVYILVKRVHEHSPQYDPGFTARRLISRLFLLGLLPVLVLTGAAWTAWETPKPVLSNVFYALGLIASALWEEAYFRGFGRYLLRDKKQLDRKDKWLLAAGACIPALFSLLNDPAGGTVILMNTAVQSLLLLGVYLAGGNLAVPLLLHILFNLGGYLPGFNGSETLFSPETTVLLWFMSFAFSFTIGLGYINKKRTLR